MWVLWSLSLMIWSTHCCCPPHLKDDDKRSEILAWKEMDLLVAREARRKRRAEETSQVILSGCDLLLYPAENTEDNAHDAGCSHHHRHAGCSHYRRHPCSCKLRSEDAILRPPSQQRMRMGRWGAQILLGPHISNRSMEQPFGAPLPFGEKCVLLTFLNISCSYAFVLRVLC